MSTILDRLAQHNKLRWRRGAVSYKPSKGVYSNFELFTVFLNSLPVEAQYPVYGYNDVSTVKYANCKNVNTGDNCDLEKCVVCGTSPHKLYRCPTFKGKSPKERLNFVHLHKLCICCFGKGHDGI